MDGVVPAPDSAIYAWCYYLLGGGGSQLAVYHGQHLDSLQSECDDFGKNRVYLYPFQYITYGASDVGAIITKPTGAREYKIADHLGSTRVVLDESGAVINQTDYEPFGATVAVTGIDTRKKFIDKELDRESTTYNTGVRQYDPEGPGFASVDPLWEEYPAWTPYHYSFNNPLQFKDPEGNEPITGAVVAAIIEAAFTVYDVYDAVTTVADPNISTEEKVVTVVGAGIGFIVPAGGYGKAAREGTKVAMELAEHADEAVDAAKAVKKAVTAAKKVGGAASHAVSPGSGVLRRTAGETAATARGKEMHKWWDYGEGFVKEYRLPSGKRADAVNEAEKIVKELKPNNPRAIKRGEKQLRGYVKELEGMYGSGWRSEVVTYD